MAEAAGRLLTDSGAWRAARARGFEAAQRFRPDEVGRKLEEAVIWARERALSSPGAPGAELLR